MNFPTRPMRCTRPRTLGRATPRALLTLVMTRTSSNARTISGVSWRADGAEIESTLAISCCASGSAGTRRARLSLRILQRLCSVVAKPVRQQRFCHGTPADVSCRRSGRG